MQVTIFGTLFFLTLITVLVAAHELGHFLFARWFKMDVEEFAIGLGKPKWVWLRKGDTEYTLRAWPLGGFVRVKGMMPEEDGSEVNIANGFYSKPPFQRFMVLFAGPLFSVVAGVALLTALFMSVGVMKRSHEPVIGFMAKDKAGYQAGLRPGDRIVAVEGKPVKTFYEVMTIVRDRAKMPTEITYVRKGVQAVTTATPTLEDGPVLNEDFEPTGDSRKQGKLGMGPNAVPEKVGIATAFVKSVELPFVIVGRLAGSVLQPSRLKDEVGGPIAIFQAAQEGAKSGIPDMISMAGVLSISLGIINLLPAMPMDGGQMLVAFVEMLRRGRRLSFRVQTVLLNVGLLFVSLLVLSAVFLDVSRLVK
ncbi:MAG: site-2 protease family protein [Armatimonadetes bacterium]|nr:site-2 protease family protein [Armatimonadota bacterium]